MHPSRCAPAVCRCRYRGGRDRRHRPHPFRFPRRCDRRLRRCHSHPPPPAVPGFLCRTRHPRPHRQGPPGRDVDGRTFPPGRPDAQGRVALERHHHRQPGRLLCFRGGCRRIYRRPGHQAQRSQGLPRPVFRGVQGHDHGRRGSARNGRGKHHPRASVPDGQPPDLAPSPLSRHPAGRSVGLDSLHPAGHLQLPAGRVPSRRSHGRPPGHGP